MKTTLYRTALLGILVITITGIFSVSAQSPDRPAPPEKPLSLEKGSEPTITPFSLQHPGITDLRPSMATRNTSSAQTAVLTGQPGLSYRYVQTFGQSEVGYQTDGYHLNAPAGMFIDANNSLYVLEDHGYRLLRYNSSAANTLSIGVAGLCVEGNNPTRFCAPRDVIADTAGNMWVATGHRIIKFGPTGNHLTQLPVPSSSGEWFSGVGATQFKNASGVALDAANNRLFVADRDNHRVQVYNTSVNPPGYVATIGVTGQSGPGNQFLNKPTRLAVNSVGQLYVVDTGNFRIQRCTFNVLWSCQSFTSGIGFKPEGIALDSTDQVYIYDSQPGRVMRCTTAGTCSDLITNIGYAQDLAVDSSGNVYVGDYHHGVILKFDSSGVPDQNNPYLGTTDQSYFPDGNYVFSPWGMAVATDGSLYVGENYGQRLLKFDASGGRLWAVGNPGSAGTATDQFSFPSGKPAITGDGTVLFPDSGNARIQVYDENGVFQSTFGSYGTGSLQFKFPAGIAISPVDGDIYVADRDNHRVQVFDSNLQYEATLGISGLAGAPPAYFNSPYDVAVDASNNIYVADYKNYRVQKCTRSTSTYFCTTFAGVTGTIADGYFDYLMPKGVVVDPQGRVLVVDDWNNRIQVFDANGAYLTSIGGSWGARSGQFRGATGIAVDQYANVYVSDFYNNRVQKYSPGVPHWKQVNINAFGDMNNWNINSLAEFDQQLYAGTYGGSGGQLWSMDSSGSWTQLITDGFGDLASEAIASLLPFNLQLYAGVYNATNGASILRSSDGIEWEPVVTGGRNDPDNFWADELAVFNTQIYAGVGNPYSGAQVWRSPSGNPNTWTAVVTGGLQNADNWMFRSSEVHNGLLYFGTENTDNDTWDSSTGGIVIRSSTGNSGSWVNVSGNGFGDANNYVISGLESFNGYLYASTGRWDASGVQVWRCTVCNNLASWSKVVDNGFGNPDNWGWSILKEFNNQLYLVIGNEKSGMQVWSSSTGNSGAWTQVNENGFGDSENAYPYVNNAAIFNGSLYLGTENPAHGPEIWKYLQELIYLPFIMR